MLGRIVKLDLDRGEDILVAREDHTGHIPQEEAAAILGGRRRRVHDRLCGDTAPHGSHVRRVRQNGGEGALQAAH